jgi:hypothetical protein
MKKLLFLFVMTITSTFSQEFDVDEWVIVNKKFRVDNDYKTIQTKEDVDSLLKAGWYKITTSEEINTQINDSLNSLRVKKGLPSIKLDNGDWPYVHYENLGTSLCTVPKYYAKDVNAEKVIMRTIYTEGDNCNCTNSIIDLIMLDSNYMIGEKLFTDIFFDPKIIDFVTIYEQHLNKDRKIEEYLHLVLFYERSEHDYIFILDSE